MIDGTTKITAEEVVRTLGFSIGMNVCIGWDEDGEDDFDIWYKSLQDRLASHA